MDSSSSSESRQDPPGQGAGADIVGRHKRGLVGRTALISVWTLASRVLGYVREMIAAALFGDKSAVFDAFITAWRVPNLFRRFLGEGALSTSFQTALTETDGDHGEAAGNRLFRQTLWVLVLLVTGLCVVVMAIVALVPDRMPGTGWAWLGADPDYVRDLTLRVMPFVVLVCISALAGGALNVRGSFAAPAFAPVALNLVWIVVLVALWYEGPISGPDPSREMERARWLAWGVLVAGLAQLAVQVQALRERGFLSGPSQTSSTGGPGARTVLARAVPLAFGAAVYQINVMIDGLMAEGLLPDGGPTLHYFANRVQQFPMALIAVAATSAVFPALQAHGHRGDRRSVRDLHDRTHRAIAFVALPASAGLFALAGPIIEVSFGRGAFGAAGVERTTAALAALALALVPAGATGLVARTYYALGDFTTPVRVSAVMLVINAALNWVLVSQVGLDVDGLAWATVITSWGSLVLLWPGSWLGTRLGLPAREVPLARPLGTMVLASLGVFAAARFSHSLMGVLPEVLRLGASIGAGMLAYLFCARLLRIEELQPLVARLAKRKG